VTDLLEGESNGIRRNGDNVLWIIVYLALGGGVGSGVLSLTQTQDRYHGADAAKDFTLRDERIAAITDRVKTLENRVQAIDDNHPPKELLYDIQNLQEKVHDLQIQEAKRNK